MKSFFKNNQALIITVTAALFTVVLINVLFTRTEYSKKNEKMKYAAVLTEKWYAVIENKMEEAGLIENEWRNLQYGALMGQEYSWITTTLGSVSSKQTAINPAFGALAYRWLEDSGIDSSSVVGVNLSGSFPSLSIAVLAAVQTIGADAVIVSSIGASSYGANNPDAVWIDMERWLRESGGLEFHSKIVTPGGVNDNGGGLQPIGMELIYKAAERNKVKLRVPSGLAEAITLRDSLFNANKIDIMINVGGNHAALGSCLHALDIPNGLVVAMPECNHNNHSFLFDIAASGVPVIHFLDIKDLALTNGIGMLASGSYNLDNLVYEKRINKKGVIIIFIAFIFISGFTVYTNKKNKIA